MDNRIEEYAKFVESRRKRLADGAEDVMHMTLGIAGEAGEVVDVVKREFVYDEELNIAHLREEIGDLLFYIQGMHNIFGWAIAETMQRNMDKLRKRYPNGYSDEHAALRLDKAKENIDGQGEQG